MDYVSSDILYLYQLGLSCKVHHLRLELPEDHNLNLIKKVLYMVRPTRLDIVCSSDEINYSPMRLDRTVDYLTHLHVKVKNRNSYANTSRIVVSFRRTEMGSSPVTDIENMSSIIS